MKLFRITMVFLMLLGAAELPGKAASDPQLISSSSSTHPATNKLFLAIRKRKPYFLPAFLVCVRYRESRGDYTIVNKHSGAAGAFQFMPRTWQATVLHAHRPDLLHVAPNHASHRDQDLMAIALYHWYGTSPWGGHCP